MLRNWKVALALVFGVGVGAWLVGSSSPQAIGQGAAAANPRYTVVETDVLNLIVVDNQTNTLFYYAIEKEGKPGDDLHLRGTLDLTGVGKPALTPKKVKVE